MALADYQPERTPIIFKGKPLMTVRGLNFEDTAVLVRHHLADLQTIFAAWKGTKLLPDGKEAEALLRRMLIDAPGAVARIIAIASDEPEAVEQAARLSAPLQMSALIEIMRLTFEDVGGPLEFVAMLTNLINSASPAFPTIQ